MRRGASEGILTTENLRRLHAPLRVAQKMGAELGGYPFLF
jgi:hypothetical protein